LIKEDHETDFAEDSKDRLMANTWKASELVDFAFKNYKVRIKLPAKKEELVSRLIQARENYVPTKIKQTSK